MQSLMTSSHELDAYLRPRIRFDVEEMWVLALGSNLGLISAEMIFRGHASACLIHPREIFRFNLLKNAVSFVIAHSHPSGDALPSKEDIAITEHLAEVGDWFGIPLLDHLILSESGTTSLADLRYFERWRRRRKKVLRRDLKEFELR